MAAMHNGAPHPRISKTETACWNEDSGYVNNVRMCDVTWLLRRKAEERRLRPKCRLN